GAQEPPARVAPPPARPVAPPRRELRPSPLGRTTAKRAPVDPRPRARRSEAPSAPEAPVAATAPAASIAAPPKRRAPTPPRAPAGPAAAAFELDPEAFPLLSSIGRNLTAEAAAGLVDPVIGRDAEISRILDILARRRSNNPILVGAPGVGKTAVVEGLAI